ncbi:MAG: D-alanyl-D-alanine carboxypeptidase [Saprospiraceae bacterium]|nr:D-alanyl-D-alanine carboxypeptidase [Saprospiraceae bacterium]MDW8230290.1 D-alanyl-D-alanine carboxypeptidase [Saprospiraceae bacterium]
MLRQVVCLAFALVLAQACSPLRRAKRVEREVLRSEVFARGITGFALLDAETSRLLVSVRGDTYFTPASNTKILTLAASLQLLPDTLPALQIRPFAAGPDDTTRYLLVRGVGDPTFLHPQFQAWQTPFQVLRQRPEPLWLCSRAERLQRFGPGWAWDDYPEDFQPERSALPVYGHLLRIEQRASGGLEVWPPRFRDSCRADSARSALERSEWVNHWTLPAPPTNGQKTYWAPFIPNNLPRLLADTLGKSVAWLPDSLQQHLPTDGWKTLYGTPIDTVLRRLMHQSDNFLAEQLLLMCADQRWGVFQTDTLIRWLLDSVWVGLPQRPRWVDGSGLSRYNLISPQTLVHVLARLWRQQPRERLFDLFPAGGRDGTLAHWYAPAPGEVPWLFAKTGTLSGVHCLSGYLVARSGRVLIFSFMHTNFVGSSSPWKREMERLLRLLREQY